MAAQEGHLSVVRCLVKEFGANANQAANDGATPLFAAASRGNLPVVRSLVKDFGANVSQATHDGSTPLLMAAQEGHLPVVQCLVKEFGANAYQAANDGATPLFAAAQRGNLPIVICLVKELGADVNQARLNGSTPLMVAAATKHTEVVVWLIKHGANAQAPFRQGSTATDVSRAYGAPAEQTEYLEARTHCANPGCDGAGLKKCAGCLKVFFCGPACIRAHWPAHKAECKRWGAELKAAKEK
jgi:predicted TIM-barrel fold metal-dependent hydrolase